MTKAPASTVLENPIASPPPRKRSAAPFTFSKLEKVPRAQLDLIRRLEWMLPEGLLTGEIGEQVRAGLRRVFDEDVMLWLDYVHSVQPAALKKVMGDPTFLGVIAPTPHGARGLVELDLVLAHSIIDLLLGAPGESAVARPLTEVEQGVLSYVLLETFKAFTPGQPEPGRHPLRLERIVPNLDEALQLFTGEATVAIVELKVLIGAAAGYLRLHLPASSIAAAVPPENSAFRRRRRLKRIQANLSRLSSLKLKLRAEIGHAELTLGDVRALRTGDVMIVDSLTTLAHKGEKGTARLRVGAGRVGRIEAAVEVVDGAYKATIEQVVLGEEAPVSEEVLAAAAALGAKPKPKPATQAPAGRPPAALKPPPPIAQLGDEEDTGQDTAITDLSERMRHERKKNGWEENTNVGNKPEDVQADAAELLNDVPLQISVELARVPITAEELVSLHVGKIVELGKAPGEPVDLSVNGKVVARGELVEVEGQLGVRIVGMAQ